MTAGRVFRKLAEKLDRDIPEYAPFNPECFCRHYLGRWQRMEFASRLSYRERSWEWFSDFTAGELLKFSKLGFLETGPCRQTLYLVPFEEDKKP